MLELREQLPHEPAARCTFCRKGSDEVYVVQLGSVFICEECSARGDGCRASGRPLMPPLKRDHMVSGRHTLKGGKLTQLPSVGANSVPACDVSQPDVRYAQHICRAERGSVMAKTRQSLPSRNSDAARRCTHPDETLSLLAYVPDALFYSSPASGPSVFSTRTVGARGQRVSGDGCADPLDFVQAVG